MRSDIKEVDSSVAECDYNPFFDVNLHSLVVTYGMYQLEAYHISAQPALIPASGLNSIFQSQTDAPVNINLFYCSFAIKWHPIINAFIFQPLVVNSA